ncbi:MAG: winged helix-turn-helix transcriptional regulator [Solirubrobacteraceae bacterium]
MSIIEFLAQHPGSTAGDLAKGLNLARERVSTRLTQLANAGETTKAARGYSIKPATRLTIRGDDRHCQSQRSSGW